MNKLPQTSISELLAKVFANPDIEIPLNMKNLCDALLMDGVGLCVAARHSDYMKAIYQASYEIGNCTIVGSTELGNAASAALINGTAIHGEDYDDTFEGGPIHAGAVIIPAVLACAQAHHLSGVDVERGISVGCELMSRLCSVAPKKVHKAGFHPTAVFGAIGSAGAVASALRFPPEQWVNALGIVGSMASGIIEYLAEGTWTKRMHPGWAAQSGYRAARMAQAGFTGPRTLFEGEHGFFHAFANQDENDFTQLLKNIGQEWISSDMAFKPYACGTMAHPYIDCAKQLIADGLEIDQIERIECNTAEGIVHRLWEPLAQKQNPSNAYSAKFSIPYAIAVGLIYGDAGLKEYEDMMVKNSQILSVTNKITYRIDPSNPYPNKFTGHIKIFLKNGNVQEVQQDFFRGGKEAPMSMLAIEDKFAANCMYGGWSQEQVDRAYTELKQLRSSSKVLLTSLSN